MIPRGYPLPLEQAPDTFVFLPFILLLHNGVGVIESRWAWENVRNFVIILIVKTKCRR